VRETVRLHFAEPSQLQSTVHVVDIA
jgi:hypothetical protein